jgi:hypothetical protein
MQIHSILPYTCNSIIYKYKLYLEYSGNIIPILFSKLGMSQVISNSIQNSNISQSVDSRVGIVLFCTS